MTKFATFEDGFPTGFYDAAIHGEDIPSDAAEISDEQWQEFLDNPGLRKWDGSNVVVYDPPPPAVTLSDIEAERARRLAIGFDYDFGDARGVHHIGTTTDDMAGWDEVTKLANALVATGDTATTIRIATGTGVADVTGLEWQHILIAAGAFRQPIWQASFVLQTMNPIPADYTEDMRWNV